MSEPSEAGNDSPSHTFSMKRYNKDLDFKNRVLREKEKGIFNDKMLQKMSKQKIST